MSALPPFEVRRPKGKPGPLVFASPHSGRIYPAAMMDASALDAATIRRSEDAFVDELIEKAPQHGATLLLARLAREVPLVRYFKLEVPGTAAKLRALIEAGGDAIAGPRGDAGPPA